ncbi:ethylbenzene dehydrogenase-related protein (plasmid) [Halobaculum sp. CBA1158]|uniref:ethylbenzene dehydrogenase-related protein n=1 Tax=Halobaculum sp. CBA1158 TaxID=2904243 RepID=UPI001F2A0623|nr:ethylbenzene dehydrogenase-related protein [Halobaculum sp. CBA1158]UIP01435.1 ethylbenzene dehydrogenase-related protein [Halobaculum sp. CBA1158]
MSDSTGGLGGPTRSSPALRERLVARVDASAARGATVVTVVVLAALLSAQAALGAAVTGGAQPVAAVDSAPTEPNALAWENATARTVELNPQRMALPYGGGSVDELTVETAANDTHVAFRLTWEDPTADTNISEPNAYSDAAAIMLRRGEQPPIMMGGGDAPVNIWYWRASWQHGEDVGGDMYTYPHPSAETKPGLAADNPLSKQRYSQYGQNYYAKGYGSLSYADSQPVRATGRRTDDGWQVVFVRERTADGTYDAGLTGGEPVHLAFAVWNGSTDEVNGKKSITLRFSRLQGDELSVPSDDSGGSDGSGDGTASGEAGSGGDDDGLWVTRSFGNGVAGVVGVVVVTYLVAYRSIRKRS